MLGVPGISKACPVSRVVRGITSPRLSRKWGRLSIRTCSTELGFRSVFVNELQDLPALVALSNFSAAAAESDGRRISITNAAGQRAAERTYVKRRNPKDFNNSLQRAEKSAQVKVKSEDEEEEDDEDEDEDEDEYEEAGSLQERQELSKQIALQAKKKLPEPKDIKAARRFFNLRFKGAARLSKVMAAAGVASRRACEEIIFSGKVVVNGKVCKTPETHVDPLKDMIYIGGCTLPRRLPPKIVFALYKPKGYICADVKEKKTVYLLLEDFFRHWAKNNPGITKPRFFTVGRLDVGTTGLIFLTNDGEFAHKVSHPSSGITKEYLVTVGEKITKNQFRRIAAGTEVDGVLCVPISVELVPPKPGDSRKRLRIVVSEGRNREVRQLVENAFLQVHALKRVRVGGMRLPSKLSLGEYFRLTAEQISQVTEADPVLLEDERAQLALSSRAAAVEESKSKALVEAKKEKPAAVDSKKFPLLTQRKDVQAVIEGSSCKPLMYREVQRMVSSANGKNPTRRVRPIIFK